MRSREVFGESGLPLGGGPVTIDGSFGPHAHEFVEVIVGFDGSGRHRSAGGLRVLEPGSVVVLRPGVWHGYEVDDRLTVLNLYLHPMLVHGDLSWVLGVPSLALALLGPGQSDGFIGSDGLRRVAVMMELLARPSAGRPLPVLLGAASCILGELVEARFSAAEASAAFSAPVRDGMLLVAEDLATAWTVPELSRRLRVSPSTLHRLFREQTGVSLLAWLNQFRGERAATLLTQTDLAIADIAQRVGWGDPNYLARRFRQLYGVSPSEYRRLYRPA